MDSSVISFISKVFIRNSVTNELVLYKENILSESDLNFNLSYLPNGIYIISIESSDSRTFSKTFQILK